MALSLCSLLRLVLLSFEPNGYGIYMCIKESKAQLPYVHTQVGANAQKRNEPVRTHPSGRVRTEKKQNKQHVIIGSFSHFGASTEYAV